MLALETVDQSVADLWSEILASRGVLVSRSSLSAWSEAGADALASLGLVDRWRIGADAGVCLSTFAAASLGLRAAARGARWVWIDASAPEPRERRARRKRPTTFLDAEAVVDEAAEEPWVIASTAEDLDRLMRGGRRRSDAEIEAVDDAIERSRPTMILEGCVSWPPIERHWVASASRWVAPRACPVCRGARLSTSAYCLWCDRWGLDAALVGLARRARENASRGRSARRRVLARV